ncbi:unnamed protein product, partial [Symbiodinium necroappetens]
MMIVSGGSVNIRESTAQDEDGYFGSGGAVYAENMNISGGNITITESKALVDG